MCGRCDPPVRKYGSVSYKILSSKKAVPGPCPPANPMGCQYKCPDGEITKPIGYVQIA